jgi:hypothetical protein
LRVEFNFFSLSKGAFIAVVALVNTKLLPMNLWTPDDLDKIILYGDINYRKHMKRCCHRQTALKPPEIKFKVYTRKAKIFTEIGKTTSRGIFDPKCLKDLVSDVEKMFKDFDCLIFTYCDQNFAIWKEHKAFYILNSEDCDEQGKKVGKGSGACCVVRCPNSIEKIVEYLSSFLKVPNKQFKIFSLKINGITTLEQEVKNLKMKLTRKTGQDEAAHNERIQVEAQEPKLVEPTEVVPKIASKTGLAAIEFLEQPEVELADDFKMSPSPPQGILICKTDKARAFRLSSHAWQLQC